MPFAAIGIASLGPLFLDPRAPNFGHIGKTPKPSWAGCDIHGHFTHRFAVPDAIDPARQAGYHGAG
jgi:fructokinase